MSDMSQASGGIKSMWALAKKAHYELVFHFSIDTNLIFILLVHMPKLVVIKTPNNLCSPRSTFTYSEPFWAMMWSGV